MGAKRWFNNFFRDLTKGGLQFCIHGLGVSLSGRKEREVAISGVGKMIVRPGNSDFQTIRQVFRDRDYLITNADVSGRINAAYEAILRSGATPIIIDAGANVGAATRWFAHMFPEAAIIAVEPDPGNADLLRRNSRDAACVKVVEAAIGGEAGFVHLTTEDQSWAVQTVRGDDGLPVVTVDQLLALVPNAKLLIAKVDIEGFESDLFSGDTAWIDDAFLIYIEPHDWLLPGQYSSRSFQREMGKRDFEIFLSGENLVYVR